MDTERCALCVIVAFDSYFRLLKLSLKAWEKNLKGSKTNNTNIVRILY